MSSRDDIKQVKTKPPIIPPTRALPSTKRGDRGLSSPEIDSSDETPRVRRASDRWSVALLILGLCAFVAALFVFVFDPAMTTLIDATWSGEGP